MVFLSIFFGLTQDVLKCIVDFFATGPNFCLEVWIQTFTARETCIIFSAGSVACGGVFMCIMRALLLSECNKDSFGEITHD